MSRRIFLLCLCALALGGSSAQALRLPAAPRCTIFPKTSPWNQRVDSLPVAGNSAEIISSIGAGTGLHADFGAGLWEGAPIGIPITVVGRRQARSRVSFEYADESDRGPYPIPRTVKIEGGRSSTGDRHALIVDRNACRLYELYALYPAKTGFGRDSTGSTSRLRRPRGQSPHSLTTAPQAAPQRGWRAGSGAIWSLRSNRLRPAGWTSADAAGLPILPGLARYDEVRRGVIDHALRFTVQRTRRAYVFPARHFASSSNDSSLPPMGLRVRLKASFDVSGYPRQARIVLVALKRYGMLVADNGSSWYITGAPDPHWSNDQLHTLGRVQGSDFEVVQGR
jgi:hypothetical protein